MKVNVKMKLKMTNTNTDGKIENTWAKWKTKDVRKIPNTWDKKV